MTKEEKLELVAKDLSNYYEFKGFLSELDESFLDDYLSLDCSNDKLISFNMEMERLQSFVESGSFDGFNETLNRMKIRFQNDN